MTEQATPAVNHEGFIALLVKSQLAGYSLNSSLSATKASLTQDELVVTFTPVSGPAVSGSVLVDQKKDGQDAPDKDKEAFVSLALSLLGSLAI